MSQSKTWNNIADREDVRIAGTTLVIDFDKTAVSQFYTSKIKTQITICIWTTSNSHKQVICCYFFVLSVYGVFHSNVLVCLLSTFSFCIRNDFDASLLHALSDKTSHVFIKARKYRIQSLNDRYFRTEFGEHLTKFSTDISTADND
ncbi:hypothetical protein D3C81_1446570 [compost metagenome]